MTSRRFHPYLFAGLSLATLAWGCSASLRARNLRIARDYAMRELECPHTEVTQGASPDLFEVNGCGVVATYRCTAQVGGPLAGTVFCSCDQVHSEGGVCPRVREEQEMQARRAVVEARDRRDAARPVCWQLDHQGETLDLHGIWGDAGGGRCGGEDCVFAVGEGGAAWHFDGESWMEMQTPTVENLLAVAGRSRRDVFAVGRAGVVIRWDGRDWRLVRAETSQTLWSVAVHAGDVWAVGEGGTVLRYDGRVFRRQDVSVPPSMRLTSIHGSGDRLVAVGNTYRGDEDAGVLLTRERGRWSVREVPEALEAVLVEPRGVVATTRRGRVLAVRGAELSELAYPEPDIRHLFMVRAGATLLVGGTLRGREDAGFELIRVPADRILHDAWVGSPDHVLAVGRDGRIFRYDPACGS